MTGEVTFTIRKRVVLAEDFAEVEVRAKRLERLLAADGYEVVARTVSEYREADQVEGEVRA